MRRATIRYDREILLFHGFVADSADRGSFRTRFKWSLVDTVRGTRDSAPSAGFRHKHELFMVKDAISHDPRNQRDDQPCSTSVSPL